MANFFNKTVIVGLGLIGGSLGKAFIKNNISNEVWGTDISTPILIQGIEAKAITNYSDSMEETFKGADLIIISAPVDKIISVLEKCLPYIPDGALVTDTGSVKEKIVNRAVSLSKNKFEFVGGHPMAGSEKGGISSAKTELLLGHTFILTPHQDLSCYTKLKSLIDAIKAIGMVPAFLEPAEHDRIIANISHLPHLIAAILMTAVGTKCTRQELQTFTGNGFKDTTRISAGSPDLWSQILSLNRANVLDGLERFQDALKALSQAIQHNDINAIGAFLEYAAVQRTRLTAVKEEKNG